jgi:hypothetical protein
MVLALVRSSPNERPIRSAEMPIPASLRPASGVTAPEERNSSSWIGVGYATGLPFVVTTIADGRPRKSGFSWDDAGSPGGSEEMAEPVVEYSISPHAAFELERRAIDESIVRRVLAAPEQRESVRLRGARHEGDL